MKAIQFKSWGGKQTTTRKLRKNHNVYGLRKQVNKLPNMRAVNRG